MLFDPGVYPAEERVRLIALGKQYGSEDTLAQANKTLEGLKTYAGVLAADGFSEADGAELVTARDALLAAGIGREGARSGKSTISKAYAQTLRDGRAARESARAILINSRREIAKDKTKPAEVARGEIDSVLTWT